MVDVVVRVAINFYTSHLKMCSTWLADEADRIPKNYTQQLYPAPIFSDSLYYVQCAGKSLKLCPKYDCSRLLIPSK